MSKSNKPVKPINRTVIPPAEKERQAQVYLANEKKTYFNLFLANLVQAGKKPKKAVDIALEAADYALEKLYNIEKNEGDE